MTASYESTAKDRVFDIVIGTGLFAADWSICDRISSYVANLVSQRRTDSLRYANLFSSVLNELLEIAFRCHHAPGEIACTVYRGGPGDSIELSVPCDAATRTFYESAVAEACRADVAEHFVKTMLDEHRFDPQIGLMALAADYQAKVALDVSSSDRVTIIVDFVLDELAR